MNKCFWRLVLVAGTAALLAGCGNKETKDALDKSAALENQKLYYDANKVLLDAMQARDTEISAEAGAPSDSTTPPDAAASAALHKKELADPEYLKLERAQISVYLYLERADLASAVYADVLTGNPTDTVAFDLLHDKDPLIRTGAVRILGLAANANAIDALTGATKDSDQDVRRSAIVALGSIKDPRTVPPLVEALKDSYWDARSEAANALGGEHQGSAVKPLLDAVPDSDKTVEGSVEAALLFLSKKTETPDGHAAPAAASPEDFAARLNDPNPKIVLISAVCLAIMKDPRSVPVLLTLVKSTDMTTKLDAVKGLGETGDASVLPTLRATLKDPDVNMRGWSIIGLGSLKDQASLPDLQAIVADPSEPDTIKQAAMAAINNISPPVTPSPGP